MAKDKAKDKGRGKLSGTLGSHHGKATRGDGSGRFTGDVGVDRFKAAVRSVPEKERIAGVKALLRGMRKG